MNREIKFRAFHKETKTMSYGIDIPMLMREKELVLANEFTSYEFMQFTGFTIKGNDELYENDLIENDGEMFRIEFLDGSWECINIVNGENIALSELASSRDTCLQGNIYQNQELINK